MKISVFGIGYVGCVTAACLAREGHDVVGVDVDPFKVQCVNDGKAPFFESGLTELVSEVVNNRRLRATRDHADAVRDSEIAIVCVGTPTTSSGAIQLDHVKRAIASIGKELQKKSTYFVVALRSTVLPAAIEEELIPHLERHAGRRIGEELGVVCNPEFLREGVALKDFRDPPWTIIGSQDCRAGDLVQAIYKPLAAPVVRTDLKTAALLKYFSNAFHALKVVFANEVGSFCRELGVDGKHMMDIFCMDRSLNISPRYLKPGFAFGGSCLPKDLKALMAEMGRHNLTLPIMQSIITSNEAHLSNCIRTVIETGRRRIGLVGLSFKPNTDDLRESPAVELAERLIGKGFDVRIYEPNIAPGQLHGTNLQFIERSIPHIWKLLVSSLDDLMQHAETIVLMHELETEDRQYFSNMSETQVCIDLAKTLSAEEISGEYRSLNTPLLPPKVSADTSYFATLQAALGG